MTMIQDRVSAELAAKLFRGCADPTRLAVLLALQGGERRVVDLVAEVGGSQANISAHLACLKGCGLVTDRPQGRASYYRIARPEVRQLLEAAEGLLAAIGHKVTLCDRYAEPAAGPAGGCCTDGAPA
jgi:DNA-binding transcriptional ArsR family regulator